MHEYCSPDSHPNLVAGRSVVLMTFVMDSARARGHGGSRKSRQKMVMEVEDSKT